MSVLAPIQLFSIEGCVFQGCWLSTDETIVDGTVSRDLSRSLVVLCRQSLTFNSTFLLCLLSCIAFVSVVVQYPPSPGSRHGCGTVHDDSVGYGLRYAEAVEIDSLLPGLARTNKRIRRECSKRRESFPIYMLLDLTNPSGASV